ncbi:MAG TPA: peptidoglycan-associated lipoprotein Pal [Gammaproteobacteria bacterium]
MIRHSLVLTFLAALLAAGCGNRQNTLPDAAEGAEAGGGFEDASTTGVGGGSGIQESALEAEQRRLMEQLVVYFEYDSAEIRPEFNQMLAAHGRYLAANPNVSVRLEGHADERGSREYNIGLGERRAQAVRRVLALQGASPEQLSTVSYGEERPAVLGSDEEAWRLNRRVELVYRR